jgi:hypothetical protein
MRRSTNRHGLIGLVAALSWAACGGDAAESELDAGEIASDADEAVPNDDSGDDPSATIRFVNLWVDEGAGVAVDVHMSPLMGGERRLFQNVAFGTVTETASVPADVRFEVYRAGEAGADQQIGTHFLSSSDLEAGDRLTLVLGYTRPIREGGMTGGFEVFHDVGDVVSGGMPARSVDGALLVVSVSPANRVLGDARETFTFGSPGQGCLRPAGSPPPSTSPNAITTSMGGTAVITYDVEPGSHQIAAYGSDAVRCEGSPRIGPVEVDVAAGGRTYLFAYAVGADDLRLLAVRSSGGE